MVYFFNFSVTILLLFHSNLTIILGKTVEKRCEPTDFILKFIHHQVSPHSPPPNPVKIKCLLLWLLSVVPRMWGRGRGVLLFPIFLFNKGDGHLREQFGFSQLGLSKVVHCVGDIRQFAKSNYIRVKLETSYVTSSGKHWKQYKRPPSCQSDTSFFFFW